MFGLFAESLPEMHEADVAGCLAALRRHVDSPVLTHEDERFCAEVSGFDLTVAHRPDLVVAVRRRSDIAVAVALAAAHGLPVALASTGHGPRAAIRSGMLLNVRRLTSVAVDTASRTAVCAAGATWNDVLDATTPLGLAPVCGSAPGVGVVGFLLGGGLGPLARSQGFGSDQVIAFEIVDADGSVSTASAEVRPDLFWALRGGRFGLGVVTAVTIRLLPVSEICGASEYYAAAAVPALFECFQEITATDTTSKLTLSVAIVRLPDRPSLPPALSGRTVGHLRAAFSGSDDDGTHEAAGLVASLRGGLPAPVAGWSGRIPYADIGSIHNDPSVPAAHLTAGALLHSLDHGSVEALLATAGPSAATPPTFVEVRHLGGAVADPGTAGSDAVSGRDAAYGVWVSSVAPTASPPHPGLDERPPGAAAASVRGVRTALAPWSRPGLQANFIGSENDADQVAATWSPTVTDRLAAVRRRSCLDLRRDLVPPGGSGPIR